MANLKQNQSTDQQVLEAVNAIKNAILQGQYEAAKDVNRVQLALYYAVGRFLSHNTRQGVWGTGIIESISERLRKELPGLRGFSSTSLKKMRLFYECWELLDNKPSVATDEIETPQVCNAKSSVATDEIDNTCSSLLSDRQVHTVDISQSFQIPNVVDFPVDDFFKVPFSHHIEIISKGLDLTARYFYIRRVANEHLSVESLRKLINESAHEHQALMPNNFSQTLSNATIARKAVMMFKDEYLLNFINVEEIGEREGIDVDERVVEQQIVHNIKNFILAFGHDFAFIGNQFHLEVYGIEQFPDLLFFNRELNALVVIELKTGAFKTSYLGQLMGYLSILDAKVKKPHENPSIGIVLCKNASREFVELVIRDYSKPMGVATYTSHQDVPEPFRKALPNIEELKKLL